MYEPPTYGWKGVVGATLRCFKFNFSYSFLLQENETGVCRFFYADREAGRVLPMPSRISNQSDHNEFTKQVESYTPWFFVNTKRDSTVWVAKAILSATCYVTPLLEFPVGLANEDIPLFIRGKHSIYP